MSSLKNFEKKAIKTLLKEKIQDDLLKDILKLDSYEFDYTGAGYFLSVKDYRLDSERSVYSTPMIVGNHTNGCLSGFLVLIGKNELSLECHPLGENLPEDYRESKIELQIEEY